MTRDAADPRQRFVRLAAAVQRQRELLRFRHLFRNLYGFEIEWPRLRALLEKLPSTWSAVEEDLESFEAFLGEAAEG